ncbi:MAG: DeoR/GlpR family DNA-binding transcription regulator [Hyphomicrobiaceae bacterium]
MRESRAERDPGLAAPLDRRLQILHALAINGFMSVGALAAETGVSEITVRRDLAQLESEGGIKRTHGGAIARSIGDADTFEPAFEARRMQNAGAKQRIAQAAARLIRRGETVALDVGTTALAFAEAIAGRDDIKVVTNNLRAARLLADTAIEVYVPGGRVRSREHAITGPMAAAALEAYWFDTAIIGVAGVSGEALYDYSPDDSEIKRVIMHRSRRVLVLADAAKLGRKAMVEIAPLADAMMLVTDAAPAAALGKALAARKVGVVVA